jgi:hypothetical protein
MKHLHLVVGGNLPLLAGLRPRTVSTGTAGVSALLRLTAQIFPALICHTQNFPEMWIFVSLF